MNFDIYKVPTPCYVIDEALIIKNLEILKKVKEATDCKILLAQKAFSMFRLYPLIGEYLDGTTASGLFEAKLGKEKMGKETHVFAPAYREDEFNEILSISDHIVFNSFNQWAKYKAKCLKTNKEFGIRINPSFSTQSKAIYDPCAIGSRMGVIREEFNPELLGGISGLHFHTLCQQNSDDLIATLEKVEEQFGEFLPKMKWVNFGGGHHITRSDYDINSLIKCINNFKTKYKVQVYLEPGEAVALNAGFLVTEVLDIVKNGKNIAIVDSSAACHMPDVLEMPYRPEIIGSKEENVLEFSYQISAPTCLTGDVIGNYSFIKPLNIGTRLVFTDMAIYSFVKNNTFNGINLPAILLNKVSGEVETVRTFSYEDFKSRLS